MIALDCLQGVWESCDRVDCLMFWALSIATMAIYVDVLSVIMIDYESLIRAISSGIKRRCASPSMLQAPQSAKSTTKNKYLAVAGVCSGHIDKLFGTDLAPQKRPRTPQRQSKCQKKKHQSARVKLAKFSTLWRCWESNPGRDGVAESPPIET